MKEKSGRMMTALYVRKLKSRVLCFRTPKQLVRLRVHKYFKFHLCTDNVNVSFILGIGLITGDQGYQVSLRYFTKKSTSSISGGYTF